MLIIYGSDILSQRWATTSSMSHFVELNVRTGFADSGRRQIEVVKVVEESGRYRAVENGSSGYAFEAYAFGLWHSFGNEVSDLTSAIQKIERLTGQRDTDMPISEWEAYYRVNV